MLVVVSDVSLVTKLFKKKTTCIYTEPSMRRRVSVRYNAKMYSCVN